MKRRTFSRRDFLRTAAVAPVAGAIGRLGGTRSAGGQPGSSGPDAAPEGSAVATRSRVVLVRDETSVSEGRKISAEAVQRMLDQAVTALFDEKDPAAAWKKILKPSDTVGIKTNTWPSLPTGKEVEQAIERRVREAGVTAEKISIADRAVYANPIFRNATVLINVRPARVHYWSGMGSCLKNYIQFVPRPSDYHDDACANLAAIWALPLVKGKTRLNVLVMLTPLYHNIGPRGFSERYLWPYKGLIVGQDPVAVDSTGYRIIQAQRLKEFGEERPLEVSAHHIVLADTKFKLGTSDPNRIELVKLGPTEGMLI